YYTDPATTDLYTLSLHDALPILTVVSATPLPISKGLGGMDPYRSNQIAAENAAALVTLYGGTTDPTAPAETDIHPIASAEDHFQDRKSTRLNSSHDQISYAVFCL